MDRNSPIGVFDTGVGGFTVVREMQKILPHEDIIYFADSANMPYGNRKQDDILHLTRQILDFMATQNVKAVAVACNTISTLIDHYRNDYPFKIFSVVEAGSAYTASLDIDCVGMMGTVFTAQSKCYNRLINAVKPNMKVACAGCPNLARFIDSGDLRPEVIDPELRAALGTILEQAPVKHLILGCTHYPLVSEHLNRLYPDITLIDPAHEQVMAVKRYLAEKDWLKDSGKGTFVLNTSGDPEFCTAAARFGLNPPAAAHKVPAPKPL
ncbi:MAG: glutamate racemase [Pyramidobacter sp.]|nr:glutamate racemase [Pyramidobacter sp.]